MVSVMIHTVLLRRFASADFLPDDSDDGYSRGLLLLEELRVLSTGW